MTNFENAVRAISALTSEELQRLIPHWKACAKFQTKKVANKFSLGDKVWFRMKSGNIFFGEIIKFNPKYIVVQVGYQRFNVSPNILYKEQ